MNATTVPAYARRSLPLAVGAFFSVLAIAASALYACWVVGMRSLDIGTDTPTYALFFQRLGGGWPHTRLEPGFVALSLTLHKLGLGVTGYQATLFAGLLLAVFVAVHVHWRALGSPPRKLTLLAASLLLLFVSPMFVNASINAVRQGLAALPVFAALLAFRQRRWWLFAGLGALACSLHYSSALYLAFAPLLSLRDRNLRIVAVLGLVAYVTGLSALAIRAVAPSLYYTVMEYTANSRTRSGVRIDFAVFSAFWYLLAMSLLPLVREPVRTALRNSTAAYLVMLLPFFAIGWGFFSNRYLLPAWMAASLIFAAIAHSSRIRPLRHPLAIHAGLLASSVLFAWYVAHNVVI